MTYEKWWWEFIAEHEDWWLADSGELRRAAFEFGKASRDAEVAALQRSIDFDLVQAQQETIDQLRKNVTLLRNVLDDKQWKKDGDVHAHNKRVQEALAATEPKP